MDKVIKRIWINYADVLFLAFLSTLKILFLQQQMQLTRNVVVLLLSSFLIITAIYSLALLVGPKMRQKVLFLLHALVAALLIADEMYFRYYRTVLSPGCSVFAGVDKIVVTSLPTVVRWSEVVLGLDVIVLLFVQKKWRVKRQVKRLAPIATSLLAVAVVLTAAGSVARAYGDAQVLAYFGAVNYHLYELWDRVEINEDEFVALLDEEFGDSSNESGQEKLLQGVAKGRNVIVIQLESVNNYVINREVNGQAITPNMNSLITQDSIYFDHYYQQVGRGRTSDAEFASNNSLFPIIGSTPYYKYPDNKYNSFPTALKSLGYKTMALHGFEPEFWNRQEAYPGQGIDRFISSDSFSKDHMAGWGILDKPFFMESLEYLKQVQQPFYSLLITLTNHMPFELPIEDKALVLEEKYQDTQFGDYLQTVRYTDEAVGLFIEGLKKEGLYDNSIIVIYGDHYGIPVNDRDIELMGEFLGHEYDFDSMANIPCIMHIPGLGYAETKHIAGGQADLYPTLRNLMGMGESESLILGQDLLNAEEGYVVGTGVLQPGSFIDDEKIFLMSQDGIFENSRAFTLKTREPVDLEECRGSYEKALRRWRIAQYVLENDLVMQAKSMIGQE